MTTPLVIDDHCFACGKKNDAGLKLSISRQETRALCRLTLDRAHQGYGGVIHGGILATILDELMIYALFFEGIPTVTAKVEVTFRQKVTVGESLFGEAWKVRDRGKMVEAEGKLLNSRNELVASSRGLFARIDQVVRV